MSDETEKRLVVPAGTRFVVTAGEYSDYNLMASYIALEEIDTEKAIEEYLSSRPDQRDGYSFDETEFVAWLDQTDKVEAIEQWEWHISSYGDLKYHWLKNETITYADDDYAELCEND